MGASLGRPPSGGWQTRLPLAFRRSTGGTGEHSQAEGHGTTWFFDIVEKFVVMYPFVTTTSTAARADTPKEFVAIADPALRRVALAGTALHRSAFTDTAGEFVAQFFGCGVSGDCQVDDADGNYYCFACWLVYHAAQTHDWSRPVRMCSRDATFRVYLVHPDMRSMSETFRVYLLHLNDGRSCHGQARTSDARTFRMYLLHLDSMRNEHARRSTHKQPMCMVLTVIQTQSSCLYLCK